LPQVFIAPITALGDDAVSNDKPQPTTVTPLSEKLKAVLKQATDNNPKAVAQLRKFLNDHPEFWKVCGDVAGATRAGWIGLLAGENAMLREATLRQLDALKSELEGEHPTAMERLLVERILATYLHVTHADANANPGDKALIKEAAFAVHRQDQAHRRHLSALAALATYRKVMGIDGPSMGAASQSTPDQPAGAELQHAGEAGAMTKPTAAQIFPLISDPPNRPNDSQPGEDASPSLRTA
jgi:hypothetical protein